MLEQTTFLSLDWRIVERIHGRDEAVTVGYVVDAIERYPEALDRAIVRGRAILDLDVEIVLAAPHLVAECHREGIPTAVWTVNDEVSAERMRRAGVRRLTTDEVEKIRDWRSRVEPLDQSPGISAPSSPSGSGEAGIST
jgi:glycerophosphoryl diester phosphodiesterase